MKVAFIITSAINSKFGVFDPIKRLEDTILTIKSIRDRIPEDCICDIHLIDMCANGLNPEQKAILEPLVYELHDYSEAPGVKLIYETPSQDVVKNLTEIMCFSDFLSKHMFVGYDFVFKISGRYQLNDNFKFDLYKDRKETLVFSGIYNSQFSPEVTGNPPNQNYQMMSRLWGFTPDMHEKVNLAYQYMWHTVYVRIAMQGGYIDIEHALYKHMPKENIIIVHPIGLTGGIAPNGMIVND